MSRVPRFLLTMPALTVVAVVGTVGALIVVGQATGAGHSSTDDAMLTAPVAVAFTVMGALVLAGAQGAVVGRLMLAAGLAAFAALAGESWSVWLPMAWLSQWAWWPPFALIPLALLVFPDGRLPSPGWRSLAIWTAVSSGIASVAFAIAAFDHPRSLLNEIDTPLTARAHVLLRIGGVALVAALAGLVGVLWSLWYRWRRADGETRLQLMCLLPAGGLTIAGLALSVMGVPAAWAIGTVAIPVAMTVAVLRFHLYDLDQIVNRTVVWLVMTVLVVVGFVAIVVAIRDLLFRGDVTKSSLVATGLIAVAFEPLRRRVQAAVDHLLYGDRDDPYKVVVELGDLVGHTVEPNAVLPLLTGSVARSMQVPYVAVEVTEDGSSRVIAEHGRAATEVQPFDMIAHGEQIGRLLVATRSSGSRFTGRENRLLRDIATHAAVAAEGTKLVRDLRQSRERLVLAREEERRRLRRELHDGIGPSLAGMSMQLRAARRLLSEQSQVGSVLSALSQDLEDCTIEVRELVDQLRPPALDNGLEAGLRAECQRFDGPGLSVRLDINGSLDGLAAAIEVAVYRIVAEALANVARHAQASTCTVTVDRSTVLSVDIVDNGVGMTDSARRGVGLGSMQERAAELGGTCSIGPTTSTGTAVSIRIPLSPTDPT